MKRAVPIAGQRSIMRDMGTSPRLFYVALVEQPRPSWLQVQDLVIEQVQSPTSAEASDKRAIERVRALRGVPELIEASREAWSWAR